MSIGLGYALYVSIICTFIGWFGYGFYDWGICKPILAGPVVGLLLGNVGVGIYIGGTLTLIYLGIVGVGAAIPVNQTIATTVATALCIITGVEPETAITLAVPVAVLGQLDRMAAWTINSSLMHLGDKFAAQDKLKNLEKVTWIGSAIFWVSEFIPVFLCIYFGSQFVGNLNEIMPTWLTAWLKTATGMLPALGFGMLFTMMYKTKYLPYFLIGFVVAAYFGGNLQAVALLGTAAALLNFYKDGKESKRGVQS